MQILSKNVISNKTVIKVFIELFVDITIISTLPIIKIIVLMIA